MRCYEPTCDVIYMERLRRARYPDPPCALYQHQTRGDLYVQFRPTANAMDATICAKCGTSVLSHIEVSVVHLLGISMAYYEIVQRAERRKEWAKRVVRLLWNLGLMAAGAWVFSKYLGGL